MDNDKALNNQYGYKTLVELDLWSWQNLIQIFIKSDGGRYAGEPCQSLLRA